MTLFRKWAAVLALSASAGTGLYAAEPEPADVPAVPKVDLSQLTFGTLRAMPADAVKTKLSTWLKAQDKLDRTKLDEIFAKDKSTMEKFVEALGLGSSELQQIILDARDITADAPVEVPAALKNEADPFIKSNVAAAYARSLSASKVYEEALTAATSAESDQLIDPSAYFFFKAVAEHALAGYQKTKKLDAQQSVVRLLDDVMDAPERYKIVATLMFFDIQSWSKDDKDLGNIGKLMDNSGRRLDLARGGDTTQTIQKKIIFRLDEKIKELENQMKPGS
jgi:plasmid maintenance system antidote protein VapI